MLGGLHQPGWAARVGRLLFVLAATLVFVPAPARADELDTAEAVIRRGVELRRQGEDERALQEFKKAYVASPTPRVLAQMGLAEQALGRWVESEGHLLRALDSSSDPWIQKNLATLQDAVAAVAKHLGSIEVLGGPVGAEVRVQGVSIGRLPMEKAARVPSGDVVIEVRQPGYRTMSRTVNVAATEMARETMVLVPIAPKEDDPPSAPPVIVSVNRPPPSRPAVEGSGWRRPTKWVAAGLGLVGLGVGVVETMVAVQKSKDFNKLPENCTDDGNGHIVGGARCEQVNHDQNVATWAAAIGYGVGGALAVTALVLHLTETEPSGSGKTASLSCGPHIGTAGVTCVAHW